MTQQNRETFPQVLQHSRCGANYQVFRTEEIAGETTDCPVCQAVRRDYGRTNGMINRASAGTPLADELGLVVFRGTPGPTSGLEI